MGIDPVQEEKEEPSRVGHDGRGRDVIEPLRG